MDKKVENTGKAFQTIAFSHTFTFLVAILSLSLSFVHFHVTDDFVLGLRSKIFSLFDAIPAPKFQHMKAANVESFLTVTVKVGRDCEEKE